MIIVDVDFIIRFSGINVDNGVVGSVVDYQGRENESINRCDTGFDKVCWCNGNGCFNATQCGVHPGHRAGTTSYWMVTDGTGTVR